MNHVFLFGLALLALLGAGFSVGFLVGRSRHRLLKREIDQLRLALQHSQSEEHQRAEAFQRSQQEVQHSREELHRHQQDFLRSQEEAAQYRTQVTHHFMQTAELLQTLTLNYRAVYDHLAVGAAALCDGQVKTLTPEILRERLLAPPREETAEGVAPPQPPAATLDTEQQSAPSSQATPPSESA